MGSTCVSGGVVHSRALTRQVTHSVPSQTGRLPEEFLWLVLTSRARARTSYPAEAGQGCRTVCCRVLMALTGRARHLAERLVDGLGLSPHEGRVLGLFTSQEAWRFPALR